MDGEGVGMTQCGFCGGRGKFFSDKNWGVREEWPCPYCGGEPVVRAIEKEPPFAKNFTEALRTMQHAVHENAKEHGWWDAPPEDGTVIMMIVRELSELVEELRVGGRESAKIDGFTAMEEELADAVLRILDFAGRKNYRLGAAILAKHAYNRTRPRMHGNKLF